MRRKTMKKSRGSRRMRGGFDLNSINPLGSSNSQQQTEEIQPQPQEQPPKQRSLSNFYGLLGGKRKNKTNKRKNRKH